MANRSLTRCAFAVMITLAYSGLLQAQDAEVVAFDDELALFAEIPSVHSASKYEQKVTEAPASVSIVTAEEIKKFGYRSLSDILGSMGGTSMLYDRNYSYMGLRGFMPPGDYNTRILILVDGVRLNDAVYLAGPVGTEFPVGVDMIDRVELVRGPSSSIYGTSAFLGVVNVITKRGRDYQGAELSAQAGSFSTVSGPLSYGDQLDNGFEFLVSGNLYRTDGDTSLYFQEFDDPESNNGIARKSDEDRSENLFTKLAYKEFTLEGVYSTRSKKIPTAPWGTVFNDRRNETNDNYMFLDLSYDHAFSIHSRIVARLNYMNYEYDGDYVYDWAEEPTDPPYLVVNRDLGTARTLTGEVQYDRTFGEKHKLTVGTEYGLNLEMSQQNYDEDVYLDDDRELDNWGVYLQDEFRISPKLLLSAGLRYDDYDSFGSSTNPRMGLIYSPADRSTLKFLYGTAFRAPSVYELYYDDGGETQKAAGDLDPETITTYEVIWERQLNRSLRSTTSVFRYEIDDLMALREDPLDELLVFENVERVEADGIELGLEGRLWRDLEGRISYSYHDARDATTDEQLTNSAKSLSKAAVAVPILKDKLFAGIETQYESGRKRVSGGKTDSIFLTHFTLFSRPLAGSIELSASIYNVFDTEYAHPGFDEHEQDEIIQDGRSYRLKLAYAF